MINKILNKMEINFIKKNKGYPIFYVVYNPIEEIPNVLTLSIIPDMQKDKVIDGLCKEIADEVRRWYKEHPEELERVKGLITKAREE